MRRWRMQLHPDDGKLATRYAVEALGQGMIGLDFGGDYGDMRRIQASTLKPSEQDFLALADEMQVGDLVLVIVHNRPFALATIASDYRYTSAPQEEFGVWFRHYRRVERKTLRFYFDHVVSVKDWELFTMTDAIAPLHDPNSKSYQLIESWRAE